MTTIVSSKNILDNANDFKYIAERIISDIDTKYKHYPVQFFVNGLLSIELYLKTIYFANNGTYPKNNKNRGIHSLIDLFDMLPEKDIIKLRKLNPKIDEVLTEYADGFIRFRYSYENFVLHGNPENILKILNDLKIYCNNVYRQNIETYFNSNTL